MERKTAGLDRRRSLLFESFGTVDLPMVPTKRKKYDDGRHTEYQRLNEMAHIYQALNAANN